MLPPRPIIYLLTDVIRSKAVALPNLLFEPVQPSIYGG